MKCLLATKDLAVGYDGKSAVLAKVDLTIFSGTITSIVGPNGSGKSTLLKTLSRQLKPVSGEVIYKERDIWQLSARDFSQNCSYVPQFFDNSVSLTVKELVALGRSPHQMWWSWNVTENDSEAIDAAMKACQIEHLANRYLSTLSGGEKQRALIASALAQNSEVILFDEPIAALDFKHQLSVISLLKNLKSMGKAVVIVVHDLNVIDYLSDQVVLLKEVESGPNKVVYQGNPTDVLTEKVILEVFDVRVDIIKTMEGSHSQDNVDGFSSNRMFNLLKVQ